jgi:hypothetical protein
LLNIRIVKYVIQFITTQIDFFQKRQQHFESLQAQTQAQYNQWAVARAIYFIAWGGLSYWAFEALSPWIF